MPTCLSPGMNMCAHAYMPSPGMRMCACAYMPSPGMRMCAHAYMPSPDMHMCAHAYSGRWGRLNRQATEPTYEAGETGEASGARHTKKLCLNIYIQCFFFTICQFEGNLLSGAGTLRCEPGGSSKPSTLSRIRAPQKATLQATLLALKTRTAPRREALLESVAFWGAPFCD